MTAKKPAATEFDALPCPFDGSLELEFVGDVHLELPQKEAEVSVMCKAEKCHAVGPPAPTFEEAVQLWNRREQLKAPIPFAVIEVG